MIVYVPLYNVLVLFTIIHVLGAHVNTKQLLSAPTVAISILYRGNCAGSVRESMIVAAGEPVIDACTVISTTPYRRLDAATGVTFCNDTECCDAGVTDAPAYVYSHMRGGSVLVTSGIGVVNVMLPPL